MFKTRHGSNGNKRPSNIGKIVMLLIIMVFLFYMVIQFANKRKNNTGGQDSADTYNMEISGVDYIEPQNRFFLPTSTTGQVIHHKYYSLSYNEKYEIPEWVAYVLTKESLKIPNVPRAKRFKKDLKVRTRSAIYYDYKGSGYSRGHLAPAGDMAFSDEAMQESFFMSNMTPQKMKFNGGIWNELENDVRNWAWKEGKLFVVTGPIINNKITEYIGKNRVGVPKLFYKVLLDIDDPERKAIGFIIPNEMSVEPLKKYAVTIDSIENLTGINFFKDLIEEEEEKKLESTFDLKKWKISDKLYKQRIEVWNKYR